LLISSLDFDVTYFINGRYIDYYNNGIAITRADVYINLTSNIFKQSYLRHDIISS